MKIFRNIASVVFAFSFIFLSVSPLVASAALPTLKGSITVCKIILDADGNVVTGTEGSFEVPSNNFGNSTFTAPLSFGANILLDVPGLDANCVSHNNLPITLLGNTTYNYGQEVITSNSAWEAPVYNEYLLGSPHFLKSTIGSQFHVFDQDEDNSDGTITLSAVIKNRTLVVVNKMKPIPACNPTNTFDLFNLGSVDTQGGWGGQTPPGIAINPNYDQAIVKNVYGYPTFGCQSLRLSDAVSSGSFGDWIFSPSNTNEAGEASAINSGLSGGTRQNHFEAQFDIASTVPGSQQPGLHASVSPDRGDGARMSYLRFEDQSDGLHVFFDDYGPTGDGNDFRETDIVTLDRTLPHTVKFVMDFVNGPANDIVKIYIDGNLEITGTSWEDYFRENQPGIAPPTVDSLIMQVRGASNPANLGKGFLFDNMSAESSTSLGNIQITKYVCPQGTTVIRSANGVGGTVPAGCVLQEGKTFGYVHGTQSDASGPYPELSAPLTAGGATNGSGVLSIPNLPTTGRYLVVETNNDNQKIPDGDILGLYCIGDGDTSNNNDNQELTFVPANGTVNCVAYNKAPTVLASSVTMCKQSDTEQALSGWTLMLRGENVEDINVNSANIAGQNTSSTLVAGTSYIAKAVGTWLNQGGANPVDAEYSTTNGWTTHMDGYTGYQDDILELQIDNKFDPNSNWGAYNSLHTYAQSFIPSTTSANFRMFDGTGTTPDAGWYGDNSGSLLVNISKGFAGITGGNGCVTFTGVPYGTYTADEVMQDGWVHNSESDNLGTVVVDSPTETFTIINHNNDVPQPPVSGKVHIFKFINGVQANGESANNASFPMITPTYDNAPFTLDSDGWTEGDAPYEASTSTIQANGTYTAYENTSTSLVGTSCASESHPAYELVGYSTGNTLQEAANNEPSPTAPTVTVNGDKYIIVWNHKCGEVLGASTIQVHVFKYLDNGEGISQVPDNSTAPSFPMTATWSASNIGAGTGTYVLGNNHGGAALKYAANTSPMEAPADYTTSEVADGSVVVANSELCSEGKYYLLGYKSSAVSAADAATQELTTTPPVYTGLTSDRYIIVVNKKCADDVLIEVCPANAAVEYISDASEGGTQVDGHDAFLVIPHEAWTASISGASWIYSAPLDEVGSSPTGDTTFTRTFTISGTPTDSTLDIAADNMYTVSVNVNPLSTGTSATDLDNFHTADSWTIPASSLQNGPNTITITVTNPANNPDGGAPFGNPNPAGLLYKLTVNSKTCPPVEPDNLAPTADAGTDQSITLPTSSVTLNGAGTDTDGTISSYLWSGAGGSITSSSSASTTVTGLTVGSHTFTLTVTDNDGATDTDDVVITVNPASNEEEGDEHPTTICSDGLDNDGDNLIDLNDTGCENSLDNDESNSRSRGSRGPTIGSVLGASTGPGQVLGASTSCGIYSDKYLRRGYKNDPEAVKKLQKFLNENMSAGIEESGIFDLATEKALKKFQLAHADKILTPWGLKKATGIYYITTQNAVNNIMCADLKLPLPPLTPIETNPLAPKKED